MNDLLNTLIAPSAGHNMPPDEVPDYAALTTERLVTDYAGLTKTLEELKAEAAKIPSVISDDATALKAGGIIKRFRDLRNTLEDKRGVEKEPSLRIGNAIDTFFNGLKKLIQPQEAKERRISPGHIDVLQDRIDGHQSRKEAAERARLKAEEEERRRIAEEAQRKADEEQRKAEAAARQAREATEAAERARSAKGKADREAEAAAAAAAATAAAAAATAAATTAEAATETARDARIAGLARSSEIVRTQGTTESGAGVTLTKATEKYAFVVDRSAMDAATKLVLFDRFTDVEVEKAVRSFAVATSYMQTLPGCDIGTRKKGVTR